MLGEKKACVDIFFTPLILSCIQVGIMFIFFKTWQSEVSCPTNFWQIWKRDRCPGTPTDAYVYAHEHTCLVCRCTILVRQEHHTWLWKCLALFLWCVCRCTALVRQQHHAWQWKYLALFLLYLFAPQQVPMWSSSPLMPLYRGVAGQLPSLLVRLCTHFSIHAGFTH